MVNHTCKRALGYESLTVPRAGASLKFNRHVVEEVDPGAPGPPSYCC